VWDSAKAVIHAKQKLELNKTTANNNNNNNNNNMKIATVNEDKSNGSRYSNINSEKKLLKENSVSVMKDNISAQRIKNNDSNISSSMAPTIILNNNENLKRKQSNKKIDRENSMIKNEWKSSQPAIDNNHNPKILRNT
jgi:hypothetical protein